MTKEQLVGLQYYHCTDSQKRHLHTIEAIFPNGFLKITWPSASAPFTGYNWIEAIDWIKRGIWIPINQTYSSPEIY